MSVTVVSIELINRGGHRVATATETRLTGMGMAPERAALRDFISNIRSLGVDRNTSGRIHKKKHKFRHLSEGLLDVFNDNGNHSIFDSPQFRRCISEPNRKGAQKVLDCLNKFKVTQGPRQEPTSIRPLAGGGCLFYFRKDVQFQIEYPELMVVIRKPDYGADAKSYNIEKSAELEDACKEVGRFVALHSHASSEF